MFKKKKDKGKLIGIDDFAIEAVLGNGAFGKVYRVREKKTERSLAMKVLKKSDIVEHEYVHHTNKEREILTDLSDHPFIVSMYYAFQTEEAVYLVMECLEGGSLFEWVTSLQEPLKDEQAAFYCAQVVLALEAMHEKNIIYRDLKLENILLGTDGYIHLSDFGLSAIIKDGKRCTSFSGTATYLAPEILSDMEGHGHTHTVDAWALGVMAFILLTLEPPFYHENRADLFADIKGKDIKWSDYQLTDVAKSFLRGLLVKDPNSRIGCGVDGIAALKNHSFFRGIDWKKLQSKKMKPPFLPAKHEPAPLTEGDSLAPAGVDGAAPDIELFSGFSFVSSHMASHTANASESAPATDVAGLKKKDKVDVKFSFQLKKADGLAESDNGNEFYIKWKVATKKSGGSGQCGHSVCIGRVLQWADAEDGQSDSVISFNSSMYFDRASQTTEERMLSLELRQADSKSSFGKISLNLADYCTPGYSQPQIFSLSKAVSLVCHITSEWNLFNGMLLVPLEADSSVPECASVQIGAIRYALKLPEGEQESKKGHKRRISGVGLGKSLKKYTSSKNLKDDDAHMPELEPTESPRSVHYDDEIDTAPPASPRKKGGLLKNISSSSSKTLKTIRKHKKDKTEDDDDDAADDEKGHKSKKLKKSLSRSLSVTGLRKGGHHAAEAPPEDAQHAAFKKRRGYNTIKAQMEVKVMKAEGIPSKYNGKNVSFHWRRGGSKSGKLRKVMCEDGTAVLEEPVEFICKLYQNQQPPFNVNEKHMYLTIKAEAATTEGAATPSKQKKSSPIIAKGVFNLAEFFDSEMVKNTEVVLSKGKTNVTVHVKGYTEWISINDEKMMGAPPGSSPSKKEKLSRSMSLLGLVGKKVGSSSSKEVLSHAAAGSTQTDAEQLEMYRYFKNLEKTNKSKDKNMVEMGEQLLAVEANFAALTKEHDDLTAKAKAQEEEMGKLKSSFAESTAALDKEEMLRTATEIELQEASNSIKELQTKLQVAEKELEDTRQRAATERQLADGDKDAAVVALQEELATSQAELKSTAQQVADLTKENTQHVAALAASRKETETVTKKAADAVIELQRSLAEVAALKASLTLVETEKEKERSRAVEMAQVSDNQRDAAASAQSELSAVKEQLASTTDQLKATEQKLAAAETELEATKKANEAGAADLAAQQQALAAAEGINKDLQKELDQRNLAVENLNERIAAVEKEHEESLTRFAKERELAGNSERDAVSTLECELSSAKKELHDVQSQLSELQLANETVTSELADAKFSLAAANATLAETVAKLEGSAADAAQLRAQLEHEQEEHTKSAATAAETASNSLRAAEEALAAKAAELAAALEREETANSAHAAAVAAHAAAVSELQESHEAAMAEQVSRHEELSSKTEERSREVSATQTELECVRAALASAKSEHEAAVEQLKLQVAAAEERSGRLEADVKALQSEVASGKEESERTETILKQRDEQIASVKAECTSLSESITSVQDELRQVTESLAEEQENLRTARSQLKEKEDEAKELLSKQAELSSALEESQQKATADAATMASSIAALKASVSAQEEKAAALAEEASADRAASADRESAREAAIATLTSERDAAVSLAGDRQADVVKLTEELASSREQFSVETETLRNQLSEAEEASRAAAAEAAELQQSLVSAKAAAADTLAAAAAANEVKLAAATSRIAELETDLADARAEGSTETAALAQKLEAARQQVAEAEAHTASLKEDLAKAQATLASERETATASLSQAVSEHEEQVRSIEARAVGLESELSDLQASSSAAASSLEEELRTTKASLTAAEKSLASLTATVAGLEEEKKAVEEQHAVAQRDLDSVKGDLDGKQRGHHEEIASLSASIASLEEAAARTAADHKAEVEKLSGELLESQQSSRDLQSAVDDTKRDLEAATLKIAAAEAQLGEKSAAVVALEAQLKQVVADAALVSEKLASCMAQLSASAEEVASVRQELEQAAGREEALKMELTETKDRLAAHSTDIEALRASRAALESSLAASETSVAAGKEECAGLANELAHAQAELDGLRKTVEAKREVEGQLDQGAKLLEETMVELEHKKADVARLTAEVASKEESNEDLSTKLQEMTTRVEETSAKLDALEKSSAALTASLAAADAEREEQREGRGVAESSLAETTAALAEANASITGLQTCLEETQKEMAAANAAAATERELRQAEGSSIADSLSQTREDLAAAVAATTLAKEDLAAAEAETAKLRAELARVTAQADEARTKADSSLASIREELASHVDSSSALREKMTSKKTKSKLLKSSLAAKEAEVEELARQVEALKQDSSQQRAVVDDQEMAKKQLEEEKERVAAEKAAAEGEKEAVANELQEARQTLREKKRKEMSLLLVVDHVLNAKHSFSKGGVPVTARKVLRALNSVADSVAEEVEEMPEDERPSKKKVAAMTKEQQLLLLHPALTAMSRTIHVGKESLELLCYWLAVSSSLLHRLRDPLGFEYDISPATYSASAARREEAADGEDDEADIHQKCQRVLLALARDSFSALVRVCCLRVGRVSREAFLMENSAVFSASVVKRSQNWSSADAWATVTRILSGLVAVMTECRVPVELVEVALRQTFGHINANIFNQVLGSPSLCTAPVGFNLKLAVSNFMCWAMEKKSPELPLLAGDGVAKLPSLYDMLQAELGPLRQLSDALVILPNGSDDFSSVKEIRTAFPDLTVSQLHRLASQFTTTADAPEPIPSSILALMKKANDEGDSSDPFLPMEHVE